MVNLTQIHRTALAGYTGLATAVLYRAARDLGAGNGHARDAQRFLGSGGCEEMLANLVDVLNIADPEPGINSIDTAHEMLTGLLARHADGP